MRTLFCFLLVGFSLGLPAITFAHPGHGHFDSEASPVLHHALDGGHPWIAAGIIAFVITLAVALAARKIWLSARRDRKSVWIKLDKR